MTEFSSAKFSNVTIYRKDYTNKNVSRPERVKPSQEYKDPIAGPYEEHVLPYCKYNRLPETKILETGYPEPKEYSKKVLELCPSLEIYLKKECGGNPVDFDMIDKIYDDENRTVYMISYCKLKDFDSHVKRERTKGTLPENWVIPLTTHKCSYRDPLVFATDNIYKMKISHPKDNLSPNCKFHIIKIIKPIAIINRHLFFLFSFSKVKEREILETKTGETIYMSDIGNTGQEIIDGKLHGDIKMKTRKYDQDDLLKSKLIRIQ
ncbi:hypothetical protein Phum_PHUM087080 [Pediculus humanus corporis]|uniref:Uncharacterized protein n=1 Tax=Pediculus humanus subsp. corporis TaxID=121224 RepID=E0VCH0_PEDHC|nr:uncharacterized protein Phum_PHUM087080 [Pediculus humanus corporis]EEB11076.1 hypothetical protein Phum_PHUM087080 [Pediculus humanus corporis]